jgi:hypothetical protein
MNLNKEVKGTLQVKIKNIVGMNKIVKIHPVNSLEEPEETIPEFI